MSTIDKFSLASNAPIFIPPFIQDSNEPLKISPKRKHSLTNRSRYDLIFYNKCNLDEYTAAWIYDYKLRHESQYSNVKFFGITTESAMDYNYNDRHVLLLNVSLPYDDISKLSTSAYSVTILTNRNKPEKTFPNVNVTYNKELTISQITWDFFFPALTLRPWFIETISDSEFKSINNKYLYTFLEKNRYFTWKGMNILINSTLSDIEKFSEIGKWLSEEEN